MLYKRQTLRAYIICTKFCNRNVHMRTPIASLLDATAQSAQGTRTAAPQTPPTMLYDVYAVDAVDMVPPERGPGSVFTPPVLVHSM